MDVHFLRGVFKAGEASSTKTTPSSLKLRLDGVVKSGPAALAPKLPRR